MTKTDRQKMKIENCGRIAAELDIIGSELLDKLMEGKQQLSPECDIARYNKKFDELQRELDSLPILGVEDAPALGRSDKAAVGFALPELIVSLKRLMESHEALSKAVRENTDYQQERLQAIGKAKDIFRKFVKKQPGGEESKFYDKMG